MNELDNTYIEPAATDAAIPVVTGRKKPGPKPKAAQATGRKIADGAALSTPLVTNAIEDARWYWIGVTADCPVGFITVGGECFTKIEEIVAKDPNGGTSRSPVPGSLVKLTRDKLVRMAERIPRTVIRFLDGSDDATENHLAVPGQTKRPPRAQVITIPSPEQVEADRASGRATRTYRRHPGDRPAAQFLYCHPVERQDRPMRGHEYQTLDQTGLEWPED